MYAEKHKQFIDSVSNLYVEARKVKFPSVHNNIIRGTSHSVSSNAEDLFAQYCANILPTNNFDILIDPQISFPESG